CLLRGPIALPLLDDWLPPELARAYPWLNQWLSPEQAEAWARWGARPSSTYLLFGAFLASLLCLTVGFYTRLSALLSLLLANTFDHRLQEFMNGGDGLARNGLYFLVLAPAGAVWSVDRWLRRRTDPAGEPVLIPPWSLRLMQIQVALMYLFSGLAKL